MSTDSSGRRPLPPVDTSDASAADAIGCGADVFLTRVVKHFALVFATQRFGRCFVNLYC